MNLSWRAHFRRHQQGFRNLDPALRARLIRVWAIRACFVLLPPAVLLVYISGQHMAQAWVMAGTLCFYVFFFLGLAVRQWCYEDFFHLTYGLLVASCAANAIGPRTAVFIMHLSTVGAAGYLGYSLAMHRLRTGAERAIIDALPAPSCHSKKAAEESTRSISTTGIAVSVLWTALLAAFVYGLNLTDALAIVFLLSYTGCVHAALWVFAAGGGFLDGVLIKGELVATLLSLLFPCMVVSPAMTFLSLVFSALFQWLLLMAVVAFLAYILAVYIHYLHVTAAAPPSTPATVNEETLQSGDSATQSWTGKV